MNIRSMASNKIASLPVQSLAISMTKTPKRGLKRRQCSIALSLRKKPKLILKLMPSIIHRMPLAKPSIR